MLMPPLAPLKLPPLTLRSCGAIAVPTWNDPVLPVVVPADCVNEPVTLVVPVAPRVSVPDDAWLTLPLIVVEAAAVKLPDPVNRTSAVMVSDPVLAAKVPPLMFKVRGVPFVPSVSEPGLARPFVVPA